jgi:ADP-ribose pyrophosphatase YjhB (NUDIX family)
VTPALPAMIRRSAYRVASRLLGAYRYVRRPTVRGVRCVLIREEKVLLVRHTYGQRGWALPGGLMRRGEAPEVTARREMREELGLNIAAWRALGHIRFVGAERARHVVACLAATAPADEVELNAAEIHEIGWFPRDDLPEDMLEKTDEIVARAFRRVSG